MPCSCWPPSHGWSVVSPTFIISGRRCERLLHLYANVAATSFVAGELDDLELHQMIQPVVAGTVGAVGGAIPGFQVMTSIMVNSLLSGSANAFLTLRVGIIAKDLLRIAGGGAARRRFAVQPRPRRLACSPALSGTAASGCATRSGKRSRQRSLVPGRCAKAQPETV